MRVAIPTLAPSRRDQPPMVMTISSPAETSSTKETRNFVVFVSDFSLLGRQSSYPGRTLVASTTASLESLPVPRGGYFPRICKALFKSADVAELAYAPGLGPGGPLRPLEVRILSSASTLRRPLGGVS